MELGVTILNILWILSFFSTVFMSTAFHLSGRNPLVKIFCITVALMSLNVLASMIFSNQLETAPKALCFFQGLFLQFNTLAQEISALCFSIHVYRLIVLKINDTSIRIKKRYYVACAVYTVTFTTILGVVASHTDAIQPRKMNCDVLSPAYVRLLGYSGVNAVFSIPGVYFSGHSAFMVFRHLERFRSVSLKSSNSNKSSNPTLTGTQDQSKIDISNHNDIQSSDIESNKENKNEYELGSQVSPPPPPPPTLPPIIFNDDEDDDIELSDSSEGSKSNDNNNNEYELTTFSSPLLPPPPPVFFDDSEENIINNYYNDIHLSDDEGDKDNDTDNNKYGLTTIPSPLLPPPPQPQPQPPVFYNKNEENINNNETKTVNNNLRVDAVIVNKDNNNKNTYLRVDSTNNSDNSSSSKTKTNGKNTNTSQPKTSAQELLQKKTYDTTKSAAKRMALFCLFYIVINVLGSITTIKVVLTREAFKPEIQPNDIIGSMIGIIVSAVFCTSSELRRLKGALSRR